MRWPFLSGARGRHAEPLLGPPRIWELEPSWLLLILILQQPLAHHIGLLCHLHASLLLLVLNKHIAAIWLGALVALHYLLLAAVHVDLVGWERLLLLDDLILCHIILAGIACFTCVILLRNVVGQDVLVEVRWAVVCCGPVLSVVLVAAVIRVELVDAHGLLLVVLFVRILWRFHGALDKVEVVDLVLKLIKLLRVWHHPIRHLLFVLENPASDSTLPPLTKAAGLSQSDNCLILDQAPVLLPDPLSIFLVVASILVTVLVHQVVLDDKLVTFEECLLVPSPQGCVQQSTGQLMVLRRSIIVQAVLS